MKFSKLGQKFSRPSAITQLMDDLGEALRVNPDLLLLGGGNPARVSAAEPFFAEAMEALVQDPDQLHQALSVYQPPQGDPQCLTALADYFRQQLGLSIGVENIAIANGSQSSLSALFNLFAGDCDGGKRRILLPLIPEYVGYAEVGFVDDFFVTQMPQIEELANGFFKYHVDFERLTIGDDVGALCVSRPSNPSGNVLSDVEIQKLAGLAAEKDIPLIIDGAYGAPFPNLVFGDATPIWNESIIWCLSLSKLGLPGLRTGIVVAAPEIIQTFVKMNTALCLASGNMGPAILHDLLQSKKLQTLIDDAVHPYYREARERVLALLPLSLVDVPYRVHQLDGAFFLWLWLPGLSITSRELYQRLKARSVIVLAGEDFFIAADPEWRHQYECIRINYSQPPEVVEQGLRIIGEELRTLYEANSPSVDC